jgi:L-threonylcarbamoyladenylate synthase
VEPRLIDLRAGDPEQGVLREVVDHLRGGGLVGMPTETVYGFGCVPEGQPMRKLQELKDRGPEKPFLLLIPGPESVPELDWTHEARELAEVFWPGAMTLVLRDPRGRFPPGVRSPSGGVAIRVSPHPLAKAVVDELQGPILSTSANTPGGQPALSAKEALSVAKELGAGDRLWILDGGSLEPSDPSTLIDCTGKEPVVLRAGALPMNRIRCVLPEIYEQG